MLLFLFNFGGGIEAILNIVLLVMCGIIISRSLKMFIRKTLKTRPNQHKMVVLFSNITAIILSPIIVIGFQALFFYFRMSYFPNSVGLPNVQENSLIKYELLEKNIFEELKIGTNKKAVIEYLGEDVDSSKSTLLYDFSDEKANEKFILQVNFDKNKLKSIQRLPQEKLK